MGFLRSLIAITQDSILGTTSSTDLFVINNYVRRNPGATKAGAEAWLSGMKALGIARSKKREALFDAENPDATSEQRKYGLESLGRAFIAG